MLKSLRGYRYPFDKGSHEYRHYGRLIRDLPWLLSCDRGHSERFVSSFVVVCGLYSDVIRSLCYVDVWDFRRASAFQSLLNGLVKSIGRLSQLGGRLGMGPVCYRQRRVSQGEGADYWNDDPLPKTCAAFIKGPVGRRYRDLVRSGVGDCLRKSDWWLVIMYAILLEVGVAVNAHVARDKTGMLALLGKDLDDGIVKQGDFLGLGGNAASKVRDAYRDSKVADAVETDKTARFFTLAEAA